MAKKSVTTDTNLVELLTQLKADMEILRIKRQPDDRPALIHEIENIIKKYEEIYSNRQTPGYEEKIFNTTKEIDKNAAVKNYRIQVNDLIGEIKNSETYKGLGEKLTRLQELDAKAKAEAEEAVKGRAATGIQKVVRGKLARNLGTELKKEKTAAREQAAVSTVSTRASEAVTTKEADVKEIKGALEVLGINLKDVSQLTLESLNKAYISTVKNLRSSLHVVTLERIQLPRLNEARDLMSQVLNGNLTVKPQGLLTDSAAAASTPKMQLTSKGTKATKASVSRERAPSASVSSTPERLITSKEERIIRQLVELHRKHTPQINAATTIQKVVRGHRVRRAKYASELKEIYLGECNNHKSSTFYSNLKINLQNTEFTAPTGKPIKDSATTSAIYKAMLLACKSQSYNSADKKNKKTILEDIAKNFLSAPTQESRQQLLALFILTAGTHRNPMRFGLFNKPGSETSTIAAFKEQIKALDPNLSSDLKTLVEEKLGLPRKGPIPKSSQ